MCLLFTHVFRYPLLVEGGQKITHFGLNSERVAALSFIFEKVFIGQAIYSKGF